MNSEQLLSETELDPNRRETAGSAAPLHSVDARPEHTSGVSRRPDDGLVSLADVERLEPALGCARGCSTFAVTTR